MTKVSTKEITICLLAKKNNPLILMAVMMKVWTKEITICLFKKLLFTMENATAAGSSQSNVSRVYIWKDKVFYLAICCNSVRQNKTKKVISKIKLLPLDDTSLKKTRQNNLAKDRSLYQISLESMTQTIMNKIKLLAMVDKRDNNLSFQKTTFFNGECYCSRQQPK